MSYNNVKYLDDLCRDFRREPYVNLSLLKCANHSDNWVNINTLLVLDRGGVNLELKSDLLGIFYQKFGLLPFVELDLMEIDHMRVRNNRKIHF